MTDSMVQVVIGAGILLFALAAVVAVRSYLVRNSERRMQGMLEAVGLDPEIATSGDVGTIMKDVRYRCRQCSSEAVCERWLAGEEGGDNAFCPNRRVFEILKKYDRT